MAAASPLPWPLYSWISQVRPGTAVFSTLLAQALSQSSATDVPEYEDFPQRDISSSSRSKPESSSSSSSSSFATFFLPAFPPPFCGAGATLVFFWFVFCPLLFSLRSSSSASQVACMSSQIPRFFGAWPCSKLDHSFFSAFAMKTDMRPEAAACQEEALGTIGNRKVHERWYLLTMKLCSPKAVKLKQQSEKSTVEFSTSSAPGAFQRWANLMLRKMCVEFCAHCAAGLTSAARP
mmetsp:Transcript_51682/g.93137  ORF Transcript_51682/g.93137 Transcript_51682/m.93137 type:complete len:235 (-) Transcript_51682:438-1142(-)